MSRVTATEVTHFTFEPLCPENQNFFFYLQTPLQWKKKLNETGIVWAQLFLFLANKYS